MSSLQNLKNCLTSLFHTFNDAKEESRGKPVWALSLTLKFVLDQAVWESTNRSFTVYINAREMIVSTTSLSLESDKFVGLYKAMWTVSL